MSRSRYFLIGKETRSSQTHNKRDARDDNSPTFSFKHIPPFFPCNFANQTRTFRLGGVGEGGVLLVELDELLRTLGHDGIIR